MPIDGVLAAVVPEPVPFDGNLAEFLSEDELRNISSELIERYRDDRASRKDWETALSKGIGRLGLAADRGVAPFPGASMVVHPVLLESLIQYWSRALRELWPASGPVRNVAIGGIDRTVSEQMERVTSYMNWQYTKLMKGAFDQESACLLRISLEGSGFKKVYPDPVKGRVRVDFVPAEDIVVSYSMTSLEDAPRITHVIRERANDIRKKIRAGFYRDIDLPPPGTGTIDAEDEVKDEILRIEGRTRGLSTSSSSEFVPPDELYSTLEMHVELDLPGFEDEYGVALPYIVTLDEEAGQIWRIVRNWRDGDTFNERRSYFVHRKFLQGLGFYGLGLVHLAGELSDAATGALRALLDSAAFANQQGGFKSVDAAAKITAETIVVGPGMWVDVNATSEELGKAFFPLPYKEPSNTLFSLLTFLVDSIHRLVSVTDQMVGDAKNTGPVGTTVALIEAGQQMMSTVHFLQHQALGEEFQLVAGWNYELLPPGMPYPYRVAGGPMVVMKDDFDGRVDIVSVSDPNIYSDTQRLQIASAIQQMSLTPNTTIDRYEADRRMLEALKVPDRDLLQPPKDQQPPDVDAITENQLLTIGKPVRAYEHQDHKAHMAVHERWFAGLPPQGQQMLQGTYFGHMAEHIAYGTRIEFMGAIQQMSGGQFQPLPSPDLFGQDGGVQDVPPEMQHMIDAIAAQATQVMPPPPPTPEQAKAQAEQARVEAEGQKVEIARMKAETDVQAKQVMIELQRQQAALDAEMRQMRMMMDAERRTRRDARDDEEALAVISRDDLGAIADIRREDAKSEAEIRRKDEEAEARREQQRLDAAARRHSRSSEPGEREG